MVSGLRMELESLQQQSASEIEGLEKTVDALREDKDVSMPDE